MSSCFNLSVGSSESKGTWNQDDGDRGGEWVKTVVPGNTNIRLEPVQGQQGARSAPLLQQPGCTLISHSSFVPYD